MQSSSQKWGVLTLGALGIVYGDIGTSPLYALRECFVAPHAIALNSANVLGILSLIVWSLVCVVSIKYIVFFLRADNRGEGGTLALMALAAQKSNIKNNRSIFLITMLGIFGAALLYGDGLITPAITILGAVEGLKIVSPFFASHIISISLAILCGLFLLQRLGSGRIGAVFGPIMLVWFAVLGTLGAMAIPQAPEVLYAFNPWHAIRFFMENGRQGFWILADVLLVVTGAETLYADMGHFGRSAIRRAWFMVALPGLLLNYFGQSALLLSDPTTLENPFYLLAPEWLVLPLVILASVAAVIASQALISGVFSLTRQAIQLGLLPRLLIRHTSSEEIGQIYIPAMNVLLFVGVSFLMITFKTASSLSAAYGVAIATMMVMTTLLGTIVARRIFHWSRLKTGLVIGFFLILDMAFFWSTITKVFEGGWFPLAFGVGLFIIMTTWRRGRQLLAARLADNNIPINTFLATIEKDPPHRVAGTAVFMTGDPNGTPAALLHNLRHNRVLHERIVLITVRTEEVPYVPLDHRAELSLISDNFYRVIIHYGFQESPNIRKILRFCEAKGLEIKIDEATFFLGRETILATRRAGMALWRERLFVWMARNSLSATSFFKIPSDKVIEVGIQVDL